MKPIPRLVCGLLCAASMAIPAAAGALDSGDMYCFGADEFSPEGTTLTGICITRLPESSLGTIMLGDRCLRPGDVLTADQIGQMTFVANRFEENCSASISYLPVFSDGLSGEATMTLSIRGRENKPPVAEDSAFETYKNLEVTGQLRVQDPEAQAMTFAVIRQPKRGTIAIQEDGSFTYTPKKNKVGIDSFTYTATDEAGKTSREATVTVTILKPTDARQYSDTMGKSCRFAAEWMKNTGIFVGESLDGNPCFSPDKAVTRGEFVTMLVKALNIPAQKDVTETGYEDVPDWVKPYLAAAIRSGLTAGMPARDSFGADEVMYAEDAAAMLCSALSLEPGQQAAISTPDVPAADALTIAAEHGLTMFPGQTITRGDAAQLLYQASILNADNTAF